MPSARSSSDDIESFSLCAFCTQVDVRDVFAQSESKTVVELVASTTTRCVDLSKAASDLMDQIERNRATVDDPSDLMKLVSHVEVKDRGTVRLQWNLKHLVVVIVSIMFLAHYYGVVAFGVGTPSLGLRGSNTASPNLRGTNRNTNDRQAHLVGVPRSRGGGVRVAHSLKMLEPMTVSAIVLGCFDNMPSSKATTRKSKMAARRAARDTETVISTLAQEGCDVTSGEVMGWRPGRESSWCFLYA